MNRMLRRELLLWPLGLILMGIVAYQVSFLDEIEHFI